MHRTLFQFAVAVLLVSIGGNSLAEQIVLRQRATPRGSIVRLGDVADLWGFDRQQQLSLPLVELIPAPPVDANRYLSAIDVRDLLMRSGVDVAGIEFLGADSVEINWRAPAPEPRPVATAPATSNSDDRSGFRSLGDVAAPPRREVILLTPVQMELIRDHVREVITNHLEDESGKLGLLQVAIEMPDRDIEKLIKATSELVITGGKAPWHGRMMLTLNTKTKSGSLRLTVRAKVRDMTPVAVVVRPIRRGEVLTASHVSFEPAPETARLPVNAELVTSPRQLVAREASRSLRIGEVVTTDMCLAPIMVRRGQVVSVAAAGGGIRIARQMIARADGRQGEVIQVETTDGKDQLVARVVDQGKLAIVSAVPPPEPPSTFERTVFQPQPFTRQ